MKQRISTCLMILVTVPLFAGDIHGKVSAKSMKDAANAVVYVDGIAGKTFPVPAQHVTVDQKNMQFVPKNVAVVVGTTVDFHNSDAVLHNVFSPDACADRMNLGTWAQGQVKTYTFKKPCFALLLCKVHSEMEGYVSVLPTPYNAVTSADGSYIIKEIPDGTYTVKVWAPKGKSPGKTVAVKGPTEMNFIVAK